MARSIVAFSDNSITFDNDQEVSFEQAVNILIRNNFDELEQEDKLNVYLLTDQGVLVTVYQLELILEELANLMFEDEPDTTRLLEIIRSN